MNELIKKYADTLPSLITDDDFLALKQEVEKYLGMLNTVMPFRKKFYHTHLGLLPETQIPDCNYLNSILNKITYLEGTETYLLSWDRPTACLILSIDKNTYTIVYDSDADIFGHFIGDKRRINGKDLKESFNVVNFDILNKIYDPNKDLKTINDELEAAVLSDMETLTILYALTYM